MFAQQVGSLVCVVTMAIGVDVPDSFPRFIVPGQEAPMNSLRELFWDHYSRGGPLATLWDE
mgnify:CR=1 FL=1